jgi:hypothetical protein
LGVAIETGKKVVEEARQEALDRAEQVLDNINSGNTSFNQNKNAALIEIQGKVASVAIDVEKAVEKAQIIADNYLEDAKATVSGSLTDLEQMKQDASVAGDTELVKLIDKRIKELQDLQKNLTDAETAAENALKYSNSANTASGNASSSASSAATKAAEALKSAQAAATSASNAAASAVAASSKAEEASNRLLTLHNASTEAHPALMRGQITNPIDLPSGADLNDYKNPGFYNTHLDSVATTILNSPVTNAFALEVYGGVSIFYQRVTRYVDAAVFIRRYYSTPNNWTEWKELAITDDLRAYLPKSGGKISGNIFGSSDSMRMIIGGATDFQKGGHIVLNGQNGALNPGGVELRARTENGENALLCMPNGSFTWCGKNIVRSVNGTAADAAGNVVIPMVSDCTSYVIETWTSGTSWYRKWSDGWIEQGGQNTCSYNGTNITLNTAFSNNNYTVTATALKDTDTNVEAVVASKAPTSMRIRCIGGHPVMWYACGF